jgi:hypothetical protein
MRYVLSVACIALALSSCNLKKEESKPVVPVSFEMKAVNVQSPGGCVSDTAVCARYAVTYPVFHGLDSLAAKRIQQKIDSAITLGYAEGKLQTIEENGNVFVEQFESFKRETPDLTMGWSFEGKIEVQLLTDTLISLSVNTNDFTGGAHPNASRIFINTRPEGTSVKLDNVLKPGYQSVLAQEGEKAFRAERKLTADASLSENFFEFENDQFKLTDNYGFTATGIEFYFNSYEIAPYAAGPTRVFIPYTSIKDWLK